MKTRLVLIMCIILVSVMTFSEATVLSEGTVISKPGTPTIVLGDAGFLLTRDDMEKAALAMATVLIRDDQILKLTASWNDLAGKVVVTGVVAAAATFLAVELFHALRR
jgi:hypothetical protein